MVQINQMHLTPIHVHVLIAQVTVVHICKFIRLITFPAQFEEELRSGCSSSYAYLPGGTRLLGENLGRNSLRLLEVSSEHDRHFSSPLPCVPFPSPPLLLPFRHPQLPPAPSPSSPPAAAPTPRPSSCVSYSSYAPPSPLLS